jgi:ankyrin repeat protein
MLLHFLAFLRRKSRFRVNMTGEATRFFAERRFAVSKISRRVVFMAVLLVLGLCSPVQADSNKELINAINKGDLRRAEKELRKGASPDAQNANGVAVLVSTAGQCSLDFVKLLTEHGASMEKNGESALKAAAHCGCGESDVTDYLLKHGVPYPAHGTTACSSNWAIQGTEKLTKLATAGNSVAMRRELENPNGLVKQYADLSAGLRAAVDAGKLESVRLLLEKGANPKLAAEGGRTPLMSAAEQDRTDIAQALLAAGADPSASDGDGQKAANYAFLSGDDALVRMLVPKGQTLSLSLETVGKEGEVYLWKTATGAKPGMHWKVRAALGKAALTLKSVANDTQSMGWMMSMNEGMAGLIGGPAEAAVKLELAPSELDDALRFESGTWLLGQNNKPKPAPVSFSARLPATGERIWGVSDGTEIVLLQPVLFLSSEGRQMIGGSIAIYSGAQYVFSTLTAQEASVNGTVRFPAGRWTLVKPGFRIRGGGLQFDETGISLIPGTQYVKDSAATSATK